MSLGERIWDTFTTVIQIRDHIAELRETVKKQQDKIEDLTARMIRLETAFSMLHQQLPAAEGRPRLPKKRSDD